jgi:selenocysteine lyase/cysteine desulfurase
VSFECDDSAATAAWLAEQNVIVWGGDGRIRISVHAYNDKTDIDRCLDAIQRIPRQVEMKAT